MTWTDGIEKPDWVSNETHPAQYWSGESENGTVVMLVSNASCHLGSVLLLEISDKGRADGLLFDV